MGMSIYYQDDFVTLYHGDCLTEHREWLDADVLVTDPPYGTASGNKRDNDGYGRRKGVGGNRQTAAQRIGQTIANDSSAAARDAVLESWGDRASIVFASPRTPEPAGEWEDRLVWDKRRPGINGGAFRYNHESIFARGMVRADNSTFSILSYHPDQKDHIHAKPLGLMSTLVKVCPPGTITDPFAGSGSTLVAAKALVRKVIGVELEEKYCEIIAKRCSQEVLDLGAIA
jgi:DNA modification methylase